MATAVQLARTEGFWGQHVLVPRQGVAVAINAFNFPVWGFAEKAACALLAGVPMVVKPATATAWVAARAIERIVEAGILPEGACSSSSAPPATCSTASARRTCSPSPARPTRRTSSRAATTC
jgi:3,4-dehydroadipyl-CoA semialdehyde dehydrogenase